MRRARRPNRCEQFYAEHFIGFRLMFFPKAANPTEFLMLAQRQTERTAKAVRSVWITGEKPRRAKTRKEIICALTRAPKVLLISMMSREEDAAETPEGVPSAGRRTCAPVRTDEGSHTRSTPNGADGKRRPLRLAQRRGFEPPYVFPRNTISSRAHSTTLPSLHA